MSIRPYEASIFRSHFIHLPIIYKKKRLSALSKRCLRTNGTYKLDVMENLKPQVQFHRNTLNIVDGDCDCISRRTIVHTPTIQWSWFRIRLKSYATCSLTNTVLRLIQLHERVSQISLEAYRWPG